MINTNSTLVIVEKLNNSMMVDDFDKVWQDANDSLVEGYTLPVSVQNTLDDVMGSFLAELDKYDIPPEDMSPNHLKDIANKTDFSQLGQLMSRTGIRHNYHRIAGTKQQYRVKMELKLIPTIFDAHQNPVSAVSFIALEYSVGTFEYGEAGRENRYLHLPIVTVLGREDLKVHHEPFYQLKTLVVPNLTNTLLGSWLKRLRTLTPDEHITLNEYNGHMH